MRLLPGQYVLILVLLSSYSIHAGIVKRQAKGGTSVSNPPGSGGPQTSSLQKLLQGLIDFLGQIPILGGLLSGIVETVVELILMIELLTNGAIARLLGGALPCKISLDNGFQCSGITQNGGLTMLLINVVDNLPELLVPEGLKKILKMVIKGLLNPVLDLLLGGEPVIKSSV